ncbi:MULTISPECIES: type II secretion system inner membrane protein GspF [Thioalkalivibrio]|uniref:General secretion pathway protein F n=1 Tax=Thioalkalivibrio halophilus TaxID=252474 RepID=A0A1V2ZVP9_9GAMM|nr:MULTISPECIES: type II secretion system inner membrane protein GspF [Thioalkalivibrio]OOC09125.1 type II secretion system protein GspF [Thioalkalivibrio halophilus]PYG04220.1 general secretion pathway protein F [Thioalkalivibrio sp. ALE21]
MPAFEYQALDAGGRTRKGVTEGDTARSVRAQLRSDGLTPLELREIDDAGPRPATVGRSATGGRGHIGPLDLALATRQMATLARAGLPVEEWLATVARQSEKPRVRNILHAVRTRVMEGHSLASALAGFPRVFPEIYRSTVASGEASGHLDRVLERLAEYLESRHALRQRVLLALIYPIALTVVAILVTVGLVVYVVPEVVQVFDGLDQELPAITRGLIATSDALRDWGLAGLIVLAALTGLLAWALRHPGPRTQYHRLLLHLPLVGRLIRGINTARFARTLSILSASGVSLLEALRTGSEVVSNRPMRTAIENASLRIREGSSIGRALEDTGFFPPITVHLIRSGESSGNLTEMLERAAETQEQEVESRISLSMGLFEPLLILTMGGVVLTIVLAILLPIFELNQLVN